MKKFAIIILAIVCLFWTLPVIAADKIIDTKIESAVQKKDKNGDDYVRFIVPINKSLNGVDYTDSMSVNAYGTLFTQATTYKDGQPLNAIVSIKEYNGREYGTILKFLPAKE